MPFGDFQFSIFCEMPMRLRRTLVHENGDLAFSGLSPSALQRFYSPLEHIPNRAP
jgi:hypothetical protein